LLNHDHFFFPAGSNVMVDGQPWPAVGHTTPEGLPALNRFGVDFRAAGKMWTAELCAMDSDGDGRTNGEELGDPDCVWQIGLIPTRMVDITNPGYKDVAFEEEDASSVNDTTVDSGGADVIEQLHLPPWMIAHICCMMVSWGVMLPIGALMAISFRGLLSKDAMWFRWHILIQVLGVGLSAVGCTIAVVNIGRHFKDIHQKVGAAVVIGGVFQAALGFLRPHKPKQGESVSTLRRVWEYCHKGFGFVVLALAWINIFLGVQWIKSFLVVSP
jgi:hypothetical protein